MHVPIESEAVPTERSAHICHVCIYISDYALHPFLTLLLCAVKLGEKPSTFSGWFERLDTNHDGVITKTEWLDAWEKGVVGFEPQSIKKEPSATALSECSFRSSSEGNRARPAVIPDTGPA